MMFFEDEMRKGACPEVSCIHSRFGWEVLQSSIA